MGFRNMRRNVLAFAIVNDFAFELCLGCKIVMSYALNIYKLLVVWDSHFTRCTRLTPNNNWVNFRHIRYG